MRKRLLVQGWRSGFTAETVSVGYSRGRWVAGNHIGRPVQQLDYAETLICDGWIEVQRRVVGRPGETCRLKVRKSIIHFTEAVGPGHRGNRPNGLPVRVDGQYRDASGTTSTIEAQARPVKAYLLSALVPPPVSDVEQCARSRSSDKLRGSSMELFEGLEFRPRRWLLCGHLDRHGDLGAIWVVDFYNGSHDLLGPADEARHDK
jgi:hypothetical protein